MTVEGGTEKGMPLYTKRSAFLLTFLGAENGARTRDLNLGKVALYQLSYFRNKLPSAFASGLQR